MRDMLNAVKKIPFVRPAYHFALSLFSALCYGFPSRRLLVVGVTGTKGKTTALALMAAVCDAGGRKTALLSSTTVKIGKREKRNNTENTMPGRFAIQRFLRRAVRAECTVAFVEVTSEGVSQYRHRFIDWNAGFILNLHPEHIESHGSFERYRAAKLAFLEYVARRGGRIFVNRSGGEAAFFANALRNYRPILYAAADYEGLIYGPRNPFFEVPFNAENAAAAVAFAKELSLGDEAVLEALRGFRGVPGRMEYVQREPFSVLVDYAHTPDSLEAAYRHVRDLTKKKMICVLGSAGGGRDKWKRPALGKIAAGYCDAIVLTDEDPYNEDPHRIMDEIENGVRDHPRFASGLSAMTWKLDDRREAIATAISLAGKEDAVVITGKGSERWIHGARGKKIPWSDTDTVRELLAEKKKAAP